MAKEDCIYSYLLLLAITVAIYLLLNPIDGFENFTPTNIYNKFINSENNSLQSNENNEEFTDITPNNEYNNFVNNNEYYDINAQQEPYDNNFSYNLVNEIVEDFDNSASQQAPSLFEPKRNIEYTNTLPQNLINSSQNGMNSSQNLINSSQNGMNSSQNLINSSQNLINSSQNGMNSSQNGMNSSQNLIPPTQNIMANIQQPQSSTNVIKNSSNEMNVLNFDPNDEQYDYDATELAAAFIPPLPPGTKPDSIDFKKQNVDNYNARDFLPKQVNDEWFETDFSLAKYQLNDDKLINTEKYIIGINTVGESLKNATYDIRGTIPNPKFIVSPWMNSTYEPDFNLKPLC